MSLRYEQSAKSREDAIHKDGALAMIAAIAEVTLTDVTFLSIDLSRALHCM